MNKGIVYVLLLLLSLLLIAVDHRGITMGDHIFRAVGLSPWSSSEYNLGFHFSAIVGILMLFVSGGLLTNHYRAKYAKTGRIVVIGAIGFLVVFPYLSSSAMTLVHFNKSGITTLDYLPKDSSCSYNTQANVVEFKCRLQLLNYGNGLEKVNIQPVFEDNDNEIIASVKIEEVSVDIPPRSKRVYHISFKGNDDDARFASGHTQMVGVRFKNDSQEKVLYVR